MTSFKLIGCIAIGYVLGTVLWEVLAVVIAYASKIFGRAVALLQLMISWQRAVVAQRKAEEQAREIVKE